MFTQIDALMELARIRQTELIQEAAQEQLAREAIQMQKQTQRQKKWSTRLGRRLIQWGFRLLKPEPAVDICDTNLWTSNGNGMHHEEQARRKVMKLSTKAKMPLYLYTRVTPEIEIETTQFGKYYLTYYRSPHRVAALERYLTEAAARQGHHKWANKDWASKPFSAVVLEEG